MINIEKIYKDWLKARNTLHFKKRYQGHEKWFHASSSGMCLRKHYFQHVAEVEPKEVDEETLKLFRLGDLVHEDIQSAVRDYADANGLPILIEKEILSQNKNLKN